MDTATPEDRATAVELLKKELREEWLRTQIKDSTLHPVVAMLFSGLWVLAWVIEPHASDSPAAIALMTFLRFVPIFTVGGSLCGRTGTGTMIGVGLFFALMGAESLSIMIWDADILKSSAKLVHHAATLANLLYLDGLLCGTAILALRPEMSPEFKRYWQLSLLLLAAVHVLLVFEITYACLRNAQGPPAARIDTVQASDKS